MTLPENMGKIKHSGKKEGIPWALIIVAIYPVEVANRADLWYARRPLAAVVCLAKIWLVDRILFGNDDITFMVDLVVCLALCVTVIIAKLVGCTLPLAAKALKLDPAVKAGLHKTVSASKETFLSNTAQKRYGRRQPYHSAFSCLGEKSSLLKCFAVLPPGFFLAAKNICAEILGVFPADILKLQGKRSGQNRIMFYETPPNGKSFYFHHCGCFELAGIFSFCKNVVACVKKVPVYDRHFFTDRR